MLIMITTASAVIKLLMMLHSPRWSQFLPTFLVSSLESES